MAMNWNDFSEKYADAIASIAADDGNKIGTWGPSLSAAKDMLVKECEKRAGKRWTDVECFGIPEDFDFAACAEDIDHIRHGE